METIYKLTPQMKTYNELGFRWKPFLMHLQAPEYRSKIVNTDAFGLRFNNQELKNSIFDEDYSSKKKISTIVGASSVFGIGATQDQFTIPSLLTDQKNFHFYNLGGRAYSGFQEIILFNSLVGNINKLEQIIIFSGVNDLFLNEYNDNYDEVLGPGFYLNEFENTMSYYSLSWKKKLFKNFENLFKNEQKINNLKKKNIKETIKRNLFYWSIIQKGMSTKLIYFLQPFASWCSKELSNEEKIIFEELDNASIKTYKILKKLDMSKYKEYKIFLSQACADLNIEFFDCNEYFSKKEFDKKWLFVDRIHLTDLGNKHISEYIKSKI